MDIEKLIEETLRNIVMVFMMDEFEILCWVGYIDKMNLLDLFYNVDDPYAMIKTAENTIFNLACSTKSIVNDKKVKDPIWFHI